MGWRATLLVYHWPGAMSLVGRLGALVAAMLLAGTACGSQSSSTSSSSSTQGSPATSSNRPILHMTAVGSSWGVVAVNLSGERKGTNAGWGFTWSPDGRYYASFGNDHKTVYLVSGQGTREDVWTARANETLSIYWPPVAWNPDGHRIAVATENDTMAVSERRHWLVVIDVVKKAEVARKELSWQLFDNSESLGDPPRNFAWSPDGNRVLLNWDRSAVVNPSTGAVSVVTTSQAFADWGASDTVYYISIGDGPSLSGLYEWNASTGKTNEIASAEDLAKANLYANPMSLLGHGLARRSPDGSKLAVVTWKNSAHQLRDGTTIRIFNLPIGSASNLNAPPVKLDTNLIVMSADWSPDGRYIAYLGFNGAQTASGWSEVRGQVDVLDVLAATSRTIDEVRFPSELSDVDLYAWHSLSWST